MRNNNWLGYSAAILIVTILSGLIYVSVQQSYRSGANDPQLQVARDISQRLNKSQSINELMNGDTVEISQSLAIFKIFFNNNGDPVQSTGLLDGKLPQIPKGVFDFTKANGEDAFTWQPRKGIRMAMVVESVQGLGIAFVAAGRSLKEVEKRISNLTTMLLIGWVICIGILFFHWFIVTFRS